MSTSTLTTVIQTMRPPFLVLTPAILLLAFGLASYTGSDLQLLDLVLITLAGMAAHISVNCLNEYADFESGLDLQTQRTPFSGGSGGLPANPAAAKAVLWLGVATLVMCLVIGAFYVWQLGFELLLLGLLGLAIIVAYTPLLNRFAWACLVAPGLGFGPLMILGSWYVLVGGFSWTPILISLMPFFMVNNLLLLNQFPDVKADTQAGRKHFVITYGYQFSTYMYGLQAMASMLVLLLGITNQLLPAPALVVLIPMGLQLAAFYGAIKHGENIAGLKPFMALNVVANIVSPALLGVLLLLG